MCSEPSLAPHSAQPICLRGTVAQILEVEGRRRVRVAVEQQDLLDMILDGCSDLQLGDRVSLRALIELTSFDRCSDHH